MYEPSLRDFLRCGSGVFWALGKGINVVMLVRFRVELSLAKMSAGLAAAGDEEESCCCCSSCWRSSEGEGAYRGTRISGGKADEQQEQGNSSSSCSGSSSMM